MVELSLMAAKHKHLCMRVACGGCEGKNPNLIEAWFHRKSIGVVDFYKDLADRGIFESF